MRHSISDPTATITVNEFNKFYEKTISSWKFRNQNIEKLAHEVHEKPSFKPFVNPKSIRMAANYSKIEERTESMQRDKLKKIE